MEPGSWWCWLLLTSSTNQRNVHELTMPYSLRTIKHFNYPFQGRSRSLDLLPVAHFACQSNKAIPFYFTQNSVSAFLFSTGEQRPNFSNRWLWFSHLITSNSLRCHGLTAACQALLSFTISWSWFKFMSIKSVMLSNHFILHCSLLFLTSIFSTGHSSNLLNEADFPWLQYSFQGPKTSKPAELKLLQLDY